MVQRGYRNIELTTEYFSNFEFQPRVNFMMLKKEELRDEYLFKVVAYEESNISPRHFNSVIQITKPDDNVRFFNEVVHVSNGL